MSEVFLKHEMIGELYYYHVYVFYDEPLIFSCATKAHQYYFVVSVPADDEESKGWLMVPVSTGKLARAENNAIEIRDMLLFPESVLFYIQENDLDISLRTMNPEALTEEYLPERGEFLDYVDGCELHPSDEAATSKASHEMRDIIEISLEEENGHTHELPCLTIANTLNDVQQLVYALAYKEGGLKGPIPHRIEEACSLDMTGMFAASVGIRLKSNELCDIYCETSLTQTLKEFNRLFDVSGDKEQLRAFLLEQNPRVACKFRKLLANLLRDKIGIKINNASPDNSAYSQHFTTTELYSRLTFIESEIEEIKEIHDYYGDMIGINTETKRFVFLTTDKEHIYGKLGETTASQVFSVPQRGQAKIELRIGQDSITKEDKINYTLLEFSPIVEEESV